MTYFKSKELVVEGEYSKPLELTNGTKINLININRNNLHNKIYIDVIFFGRMYFNVWKGYKDENGKLKYERSNHQLITGTGTNQFLIFNDYTKTKHNFINYYFELEALDDLSIYILEMGLYFDDIKSSSNFTEIVNNSLRSDINQKPLKKQDYDKLLSFDNVVLRTQVQEMINLTERPFIYVFEEGCVEIETLQLSNRSFQIKYINEVSQWMNMTLTNIEEI